MYTSGFLLKVIKHIVWFGNVVYLTIVQLSSCREADGNIVSFCWSVWRLQSFKIIHVPLNRLHV